MITAEPFAENSLQAMADNYIGSHLNYGGRCRKSYLDGMHDILTLIYEIQKSMVKMSKLFEKLIA